MDRVSISTPNVVEDLFGEGKHGYRATNKAAGIRGTSITADQKNAIQEELMAIIESTEAGLTPDNGNLAQVLAGIRLIARHKFTSAEQTITAAGALVLAHGLSSTPAQVWLRLKCINGAGANGYALDDVVDIAIGNQGGNRGVAVSVDTTNVTIRFGSDANSIEILNGTTGASENITNADWSLIVMAKL